MRVNIQSLWDLERERCRCDRKKGEGGGIQTHPRSPFTGGSVKEKQDRQPFNVRWGYFFMHFSHLTAATISNYSQLSTERLISPQHTNVHAHKHSQEHKEAKCNTSNAVDSEVKAAVLKWCHIQQLLLLPLYDYCINHWTKALSLALLLISLVENVDRSWGRDTDAYPSTAARTHAHE